MDKKISNFYIPRWEELPDTNFYLDQVINYLDIYFNNFISDENNKVITKTMINNYVKLGVLDSPINKKYNKTNLAYLFVICILKYIYSIKDIKQLIKLALDTSPIEISYNKFCIAIEKSVNLIFEGNEYLDDEEMTKERYLLKSAALSFANKLYVEKEFLKK